MVMSIPMVVYGHCVLVESMIVGSGSNEISNGCAEISLVLMSRRSMSSLDVFLMYPALSSAQLSFFEVNVVPLISDF